MLQVRVHGPGDVRVDDIAPPDPGRRDAVVRVVACGICGSDLTYIRLGGMAGPGPEPLCLGHEMAGVVDWVGDEVSRVRVGDRVVVEPVNKAAGRVGRIGGGGPEGGLTPELLVRDADAGVLHPVPDDLSTVAATCTYGAELHAALRQGNVFATQFHPEKSGVSGLALLSRFVAVAAGRPAPAGA